VLADHTLDAVAAIWLFGALALWPAARLLDGPNGALRPLLWTFRVQLGAQLLWGAWLAILWILGASHMQHGLIVPYIVGSLGWVASALALVYWLVQRRRPPLEQGAANERVT